MRNPRTYAYIASRIIDIVFFDIDYCASSLIALYIVIDVGIFNNCVQCRGNSTLCTFVNLSCKVANL